MYPETKRKILNRELKHLESIFDYNNEYHLLRRFQIYREIQATFVAQLVELQTETALRLFSQL